MVFIILFFLFSLGHIARISFFNQEINVYLYEIVYFSWLAWLGSKYKLLPLKSKQWRWLVYFMGILLGSYLFSLNRFSAFENFVASLYVIRLLLYLLGIPYVVHHAKKESSKKMLSGYILFVCLTLLFSLVQYGLYPNLRNLQYLGWDPHLYRSFGVVFDVSIASAVYGLIFLSLVFAGRAIIKQPVPRIVLIGLYAFIGFLTYARALYTSMVITLLYYLLVKNKQVSFALCLVLFAGVLLFIIPKPFGEGGNLLRTSTIESRIKSYEEGIKIWSTSPLFGIGYNRLRYVRQPVPQVVGVEGVSHAGASLHSSFLIILATTGITGLIFFFLFLHSLWKISSTAQLYVLFLGVYSLFDNIFLHPFVLFLLTMLLVLDRIVSTSRR